VNDVVAPAFAVAREVIERELAGASTPEELARGVEGALIRLHQLMSTLVGRRGFESVLGRAVHLASATHPSLGATRLQVTPVVAVEGFAALAEREGAAEGRAAAVALLGHVISLLCQFVGEDLAFRLIRRVWTDLSAGGQSGGSGGSESND
jgi:hypothetical protein